MKLRLRKIKGSLSVKNERAAMPIWKMSLVKRQNNTKKGRGCGHSLGLFYAVNPRLCLYSTGGECDKKSVKKIPSMIKYK